MQKQIPKIFSLIKSFEKDHIYSAFGSAGFSILDFSNTADFSHPEIQFSPEILEHSEFLCEVLSLVEFAKNSNMHRVLNLIGQSTGEKVKLALDAFLAFGFSNKSARFLLPDARNKIRKSKNAHNINCKSFDRYRSILPSSFSDLKSNYCEYSENRIRRFQELGCKKLIDAERFCSSLVSVGDFGFHKIGVHETCIILAKHMGIESSEFIVSPLEKFQKSGIAPEICNKFDNFEQLDGKALFDHHVILHPNSQEKDDFVLMGERNGFFYFIALLDEKGIKCK
jgi:hypothetical protein